jgi:hypothetical protein
MTNDINFIILDLDVSLCLFYFQQKDEERGNTASSKLYSSVLAGRNAAGRE